MATARELGVLRIATPCSVAWASMRGSDSVRTCDQCRLKVYNMWNLSVDEAKRVIAENNGSPCAVLYQRRDGTILTKDCPVGMRLLRSRLVREVVAAAILMLAILGFKMLSNYLRDSVGVTCLTGKIG